MHRIIRRCGRFTLIHSERGFLWKLTSRAGGEWYWDPTLQSWTGSGSGRPTLEKASIGLDRILAQEEAGELLNDQSKRPTPAHAMSSK